MSKSDPYESLTDKQKAAIPALLQHSTVSDAADAANVARSSIYLWLKDPDFKRAYEDAQQAVLDQAVARLTRLTADAADALGDVLQARHFDKSAPARVAAAKAVIDRAITARKLSQIEDMLNELKETDDA